MRPPRAMPVEMLPSLPGWVAAASDDPLEAVAFRAGAALAHLACVTTTMELPHALWRERLALAAAEVCVRHSGRREHAAALRDALHLTKAGDDPGPGGRVFRQWSKAVARPISPENLARALEAVSVERIVLCLEATGQTPLDRAALVIEAVLTDRPRAETEAMILADAALAKSLGWSHVVPLLSLALKTRDLRLRGAELRMVCHRAAVDGVRQAYSVAGVLVRGAARLQLVAPKLRAKGAARAVDLFLSCDALAPVELSFMSDRAARRLCDRLVALGAVRELTGRDTFRLYGV